MEATPPRQRLENPEVERKLHAKLVDSKARSQEEAREHASTRAQLEQVLAEETVPVDIRGVEVHFQTFGKEDGKFVTTTKERWEQTAEEDDFAERFSDDVDRLYELLGEHCVEPGMDTAWFEDKFGMARAFQTAMRIVRGEGVALEGRARSFRRE